MLQIINNIKKYFILHCFITIALLLLCSAFTGDRPATSTSCDKELEKITKYYNKFSKAEKIYYKYSVQNTEDGEIGEKLVTEIWLQGSRMKYVNLFLTVIQDENTQVLIMKDSKKIILRNTPETKDSNIVDNGIAAFIQADNLKKMGGMVNCAKSGEMKKLVIDFPKKSGKTTNTLKEMTFEYLPKGEVKKVVYDYYMKKGSKKEQYEYLAITSRFDNSILSGNPANEVLPGNKLNKKYQEYIVKDLRKRQK